MAEESDPALRRGQVWGEYDQVRASPSKMKPGTLQGPESRRIMVETNRAVRAKAA